MQTDRQTPFLMVTHYDPVNVLRCAALAVTIGFTTCFLLHSSAVSNNKQEQTGAAINKIPITGKENCAKVC